MKNFVQIRELAGRKPRGQVVFDKRVKPMPVKILKDMGKYVGYIDGDRLDAYKSQKEAEKAIMTFLKQYKG